MLKNYKQGSYILLSLIFFINCMILIQIDCLQAMVL